MAHVPATGYVCGANGVVYLPAKVEGEAEGEGEEKDRPRDVYTYIPRNDGDPHPPVITGKSRDQPGMPPPPFQHLVLGSASCPPSTAAPLMQYAHLPPQYQHAHPGYQCPYTYTYPYPYPYTHNASALPTGAPVYFPHQGLTTYPAPAHIVQESGDKEKDKQGKNKKQTKQTKKKKKKEKKRPTRANQHASYGRTPNEVYEDEIKMASKEGVYGPRDIAPNNPKPGDMFWVLPHDPSERAKLVSYYEIMDIHQPGKWHLGADGYLRWCKEPPTQDADSSTTESSASEWEN